jgi:hypothetical protein
MTRLKCSRILLRFAAALSSSSSSSSASCACEEEDEEGAVALVEEEEDVEVLPNLLLRGLLELGEGFRRRPRV